MNIHKIAKTESHIDTTDVPIKRLSKNSKLYKTVLSAIESKKGEHIVSLDLRKIDEAVADFFIICDTQSYPQMQAIYGAIEKDVKEHCAELPFKTAQSNGWMVLDYVTIVVHIFESETRKFYNLEDIWSDSFSL